MKVAGSRVIPQSLPEFQDIIFAGSSQVFNLGIGLHEPLPIFPSLCDAGLLKDDFAQPDGIRVLGFAPRQIPTILTKPMDNFC